MQLDGCAEDHAAFGVNGGGVDDLRAGKLAFHFLDAAFDEALAVLGGFVFGVFAQIALRARLGNGVDDFGAVFGFEAVQFGLELFRAALGQGGGGHEGSSKSKPPRIAARRPVKKFRADYACARFFAKP